MYQRSSALASYGKVANTETDPIQQVVMLYDGAIRFLREAADDIQNGKIADKAEHVNRALDILNYLQGILDFDRAPEVATTLDHLYTVVSMQVLSASAKLDAGSMRKAAELLLPVRESWSVVAQSLQPTPPPAALGADTPRLGHLVMG
jgi:flagellar secretion chaperone FliS